MNTDELAQILEKVPSTDSVLKAINEHPNDPKYIVPHLENLHRIIHSILPKPNKVCGHFLIVGTLGT
jgi:5,10-methenyltetrahydromethanopterin hydrogenase